MIADNRFRIKCSDFLCRLICPFQIHRILRISYYKPTIFQNKCIAGYESAALRQVDGDMPLCVARSGNSNYPLALSGIESKEFSA